MTAVSKNVDFGVLDDISHKYINTYHNSVSVQMRPIDATSNSYTECNVYYNARNAKFEIDGHVRISNTKNVLLKTMLLIGLRKFLWLIKSKILCHRHMWRNLNGEETVETFYVKELQKTNQIEFRNVKVIRNRLYVKWNGYNNSSNSWIKKKTFCKMGQYFPKPYRRSDRHINVKLDLSSYVTQSDLKNVTCVYTLATKSNSGELKAEVDKIGIDKWKAVPTDLSKLSHVVDNDVFKKNVYVKLVAKVKNIDTSGFVLKTKYDQDKSNLIKK